MSKYPVNVLEHTRHRQGGIRDALHTDHSRCDPASVCVRAHAHLQWGTFFHNVVIIFSFHALFVSLVLAFSRDLQGPNTW